MKQVVLGKPIKIDRERVFVNPPRIHIGSGDSQLKTIQWVNHTGDVVWIWLPSAHNYLNGEPKDFLKPYELANGAEKSFTVEDHPVKGYYEYNVYCKAIDGYAEGNSAPGVDCP
jgi:hypothetical protein